MEIKYEAVFGDQSLLAEAGTFTGLDVVVRNVDTDLYHYCRHEDLTYDYLRKNPVVAMRRIIRTPIWTAEDQRAGRLPEVGSKAVLVHGFCVVDILAVRNGCVVACNSDVIDSLPCVFTIDNFLELYKPIESPEEKAARLRDEWVEKAVGATPVYEVASHGYSTRLKIDISSIYDAMISGDLPVPAKEK